MSDGADKKIQSLIGHLQRLAVDNQAAIVAEVGDGAYQALLALWGDVFESLCRIDRDVVPALHDLASLPAASVGETLIEIYWEFRHIAEHIEQADSALLCLANRLSDGG